MLLGALLLVIAAAAFVAVQYFPETVLSQRLQKLWDTPRTYPVQTAQEDVRSAFRTALQSEVREQLGMPIEGYEPAMFLQVFPGLTETDFEGVEASVGYYTVEKGRLTHKLDDSRLVHSAAGAITNRGMDTLLENVSERLQVDLSQDGTLTKIMNALWRMDV